MKQKLLLLFALTVFFSARAQEQLDCDANFNQALFYLKDAKKFKQDSLQAIDYLKPCLEIGNAKAQLLMGRLYAAKKNEKSYKKAFKLTKKSAKQGNAIAAGDLGTMYKYGRGCNLNYNKARKWFKKGAELGNDKAKYSLGYLFLKGFGDINQSYSKAVKWFKKSDYPMAKYWLGVCYYYGYGVQRNIEKARELLDVDLEVAISNGGNEINSEESTTNMTDDLTSNSEDVVVTENLSENKLLGKWSGLLLKYDWSGENLEQKHPFDIEFKYDSINEATIYSIRINNKVLVGNYKQIDNAIYFEEAKIKLPHTSFNSEIPKELVYDLLSSDLLIKILSEENYLVGSFDTYIRDWKESGSPLKFVLKKNQTFVNSDEEISEDVLQALAEQEENFIKLYPNPFQNDLVISYTLESSSFVEVKITDINGTKNSIIEKGKQQKKGKHWYFFNGTNLEKGIYVVTVIANNKKKTRIIVKK